MKFRTKLFVEERVVRRLPGAAPGEWETVRQSDPIDQQMNKFIAETRGHPSLVSSPSFNFAWLDREMTTQRILIGSILTYIPPEGANEPDPAPHQWPEFTPPPADGPFGGHAAGPA